MAEPERIVKTPKYTLASDIVSKPLKWLWDNRIPSGKVSILAGVQGKGKSTLAIYMAAQVTTGRPWIDSRKNPPRVGRVILLSSEDAWDDTIKPRLQAAEADMTKIVRPDGFDWVWEKENKKGTESLTNLTRDFDVLEMLVEELGDVRLIIIDPVSAYMMGKNENKNSEVREFVTPLKEMAEEKDIAILGITHLNKNEELSPENRILGSVGLPSAARAVWMVLEDPEDPERRLMLLSKENLGPDSKGLAYRLDRTQIHTDTGEYSNAPRCLFEPDPVYLTVKDLLAPKGERKSGRPRKHEDASDWLEEYLSDGPKLADDVFAAGEAKGFSEKTLKRAKKTLNAQSTCSRDEFGHPTGWEWALPTDGDL